MTLNAKIGGFVDFLAILVCDTVWHASQIQLMSTMGILPISSTQKMWSVADNSIVHTIENFCDLE